MVTLLVALLFQFPNSVWAQGEDLPALEDLEVTSEAALEKPAPSRPAKAASTKQVDPIDSGVESVIETDIRIESREQVQKKAIASGFTIGHLLTPAVSTMKAGEFTVGTMFAGAGVTDKVSIGFSPWMTGFYNMHNFMFRYQAEPTKPNSFGMQAAYFKTDEQLGKLYKMEATSLWLQYRMRVSRTHRVHFSVNYMSFANMDVPFSLKRWSFSPNEPKDQWTFTTLQEIATTPYTRICVEFGILGINYGSPNYHFGASTAYRFEGGYIQFGVSATGYLSNMTKSAYNQVYNEWKASDAKVEFESVYKNSVAVHPEVQLQLFF